MSDNPLDQQIEFLLEMDKLKFIFRRSYISGTDCHENDAEHSWHLAIMALVLAEHANTKIDMLRVLKMLLVHDIVEIDAGDTFFYGDKGADDKGADDKGTDDKSERERAAANRLFGLLPKNREKEFKDIWEEFEEGRTAEALFAKSLDRLMPLLHNFYSEGKAWKEQGLRKIKFSIKISI